MMAQMFKNLIPVGVIILLSFFAVRALLPSGYFSMHDGQQIARLFELNKSLTAGQFPVRWVEGLGFGYGYPLFNFYPPLTYYLGEIYHLVLGVGFIDATKLVWLTALIGSAIAMYFLSKEFFGKVGGIVSALFYLYAPYHAVDAFVRGAQAELFSFVWLPLILLFSYKMAKEQSVRWSMATGFLLALLMLTHNLIFLPFAGIFTFWYFAIVLIYSRKSFIRSCILYLVSCILGFGLTTFFWLPALVEKQFTLVDQLLIKNLASYKIHFVCWPQLWDSPWGFGGSNPGCLDGVSFKIGKLHLILSAVSTFLAVNFWRHNRKLSSTILTSVVFFLFSVFMTTASSQFVWDHVSQLWYLQFPWRFLEFAVLFAAFSIGAIVLWIKKAAWQWLTAVVVIAAVIYLNGKLFVPQIYRPLATDSELTSDTEIKWNVSSTSFEFMSKNVVTKLNDRGVVWVDIDSSQIQNTRYKIQEGTWETIREDFAPDRFMISGRTKSGVKIQLQISNFPGWQLWLDNKPVVINDNNSYRLLSLTVPPGEHMITGKFTDTPIRVTGNAISLVFVVLSLGLISLYGINRTRT